MKKFADGGIINQTDTYNSVKVRLAPGKTFIKRSQFDKDKGASMLPFMTVNDELIVIDDDDFDKRFPRL